MAASQKSPSVLNYRLKIINGSGINGDRCREKNPACCKSHPLKRLAVKPPKADHQLKLRLAELIAIIAPRELPGRASRNAKRINPTADNDGARIIVQAGQLELRTLTIHPRSSTVGRKQTCPVQTSKRLGSRARTQRKLGSNSDPSISPFWVSRFPVRKFLSDI